MVKLHWIACGCLNESCKTTGEAVPDHFVDVTKTIAMPKGATKDVPDIMLTRYACYLIAQNGDPKNYLPKKILKSLSAG